MPNTLMTADEAARKIWADWKSIVNSGRQVPMSDNDAMTLFLATYGFYDVPDKELKRILDRR